MLLSPSKGWTPIGVQNENTHICRVSAFFYCIKSQTDMMVKESRNASKVVLGSLISVDSLFQVITFKIQFMGKLWAKRCQRNQNLQNLSLFLIVKPHNYRRLKRFSRNNDTYQSEAKQVSVECLSVLSARNVLGMQNIANLT